MIAVKRERPELERRLDATVLASAALEQRAVVTNNVRDYRLAHERIVAAGGTHHGVIYTYDDTLPRNRSSIPLWVSTLEEFLKAHPAEDALMNRTRVVLGPFSREDRLRAVEEIRQMRGGRLLSPDEINRLVAEEREHEWEELERHTGR